MQTVVLGLLIILRRILGATMGGSVPQAPAAVHLRTSQRLGDALSQSLHGGGDRFFRAEDGGAGDEDGGASGDAKGSGLFIDAAVDFDLAVEVQVVNHLLDVAELAERARNEFL